MKLFFSFLILLLFFKSFSQNNNKIISNNYKIINIDSTENHYIFLISSDFNNEISNENNRFLLKEDSCNHYKILNKFDFNIEILISHKINGLNKNIEIGQIYNFTLDSINIGVLNFGYDYIGHGEYLYIYPLQIIYQAKELFSLYYTKNIDTLDYLKLLEYNYNYFDNMMLTFWLKFDNKPKECYPKWLESILENSNYIKILCENDSISIFKDPYCKLLNTKIKCFDNQNNNSTNVKLYFKQKNKIFVCFENEIINKYGWIRLKKYNKKTKKYHVY